MILHCFSNLQGYCDVIRRIKSVKKSQMYMSLWFYNHYRNQIFITLAVLRRRLAEPIAVAERQGNRRQLRRNVAAV